MRLAAVAMSQTALNRPAPFRQCVPRARVQHPVHRTIVPQLWPTGLRRHSTVLSVYAPEVVGEQPTVEQFESMRAELEALREENERLRSLLAQGKGHEEASKTKVQEEWDVLKSSRRVAPPVPGPIDQDALKEGIVWPAPNEARFWERAPRSSPQPMAGRASIGPAAPERDARTMQIVHVTAEMAPIAKVGGLGDVVTGLARSCLVRGHNVSVIMPFYESLPKDQIEGLKHEMDIEVPKGYRWDGELRIGSLRTSIWWGKIAGVPTYLIRPADWDSCNIFRGGRIYGGSYDEKEAYLYLCRASLEYLKVSGQQPDVLQLHDWHAAATAMLYWECYHHQGLYKPRIMLTIHNLENTGEVRQDEFAATGVFGEIFADVDKALDERTIGHNPERINLMKGGIVYSNAVTTVSPSYAKEIATGGAAGWLRGLFAKPQVSQKFHGILNGIDSDEWDPATDPLLAANFNCDSPHGKALCKAFLQQGLAMSVDPSKALVAVVSRLVPQKGIHLIKSAVYRTVEHGGQFVLLGSGHADGIFKGMAANEFKDHPDCRLMLMYSERLAHMIYAAADIVLVPSMFEPCGLTQLIALRYGAIPVVRSTGGLADTVFDVDNHQADSPTPNGFSFPGTDEGSLFSALDRALALYKEKPEAWQALSVQNMTGNVSWDMSAKSYVDVYAAMCQ